MNKSRFIQGFAFVLFATTAAISFAEETLQEQKERLEKEEQQDNSLYRRFCRKAKQVLAHEAMPLCNLAVAFYVSKLVSNYYDDNKGAKGKYANSDLAYYGFKFLTAAGFVGTNLASVKVKNMARESLENHAQIKKNRALSLEAIQKQMEKNIKK